MKTNEELQRDVQDAIKWEPLLNAAEIGVTVKDGIVTLTGVVDSYSKKLEAEEAANNVAGVKAVVEKIEIKFDGLSEKSDNEIAIEVVHAFNLNRDVPIQKIKVKVEDGYVTLEGEVLWNFQKEAAKRSVKNLIGVKGITNYINITSEKNNLIEKVQIERALMRNWSINDQVLHVDVLDNVVTLSGTVHSYFQKNEAERIAWNAPGVMIVRNEILIV